METKQDMLRKLPAIHKLVDHPEIRKWMDTDRISADFITQLAQLVVDDVRHGILNEQVQSITDDMIIRRLHHQIREVVEPRIKRVINGTGVVLHTNLGRAVLAEEAVRQIVSVARSYSNLEYRLQEGKRGSRHEHVEELIKLLTGAEAAMVVNNNAAAVFLVLREMARHQEVVVSRGQLVEIGGSFRVSEIMKQSDARLVEVGTTNKTHVHDYEQAITEETALLMKVHTSNFRTVGFTREVSLEELVELGQKYNIPVYEDLGSGVMYDLASKGVGDEPLIQDSIRQGADLVTFSGDKLLGAPQAGIIAGKKKWIDRLKKNQLARVLRVDKMTLAGLDATLRLYLNPERASREIPAIRDIVVDVEHIRQKAEQFVSMVEGHLAASVTVEEDVSEVGGGTLPAVTIPTVVVAIRPESMPVHQLERNLRYGSPPVVGRVNKDTFLLDFRTIPDEEVDELAHAVQQACRV
ncbi:MAG: L-seryl-tRNA(Sec) selenium transferase [Bacillaceae bacterium]|nr:L-seryl-tRNA(Sec) selenium transferase [Bacillaceae bacterium]